MSYLERGVYWYLKNVFLGGAKLLLSRQYILFTALSVAIASLASFSPVMLRLEVVAAISLVLAAWQPIVFPIAFAVMLIIPGVEAAAPIFLPLWALFTALIALLAPRDMVDSWGGYAIFFGNPKGHVPFSAIFNMLFVIGAALSIVYASLYSPVFFAVSIAMLYMTNSFARHGKNDRFAFTLSVFYMSMLYYFATVRVRAFSSGFVVGDAFVALFTLFFAVQGNTRIMQSKVAPHAAVFLTLGLALGLHAAGTGNLHHYQFVFASMIFPLVIILFLSSRRFMHYFTRQPSVTKAILDFGRSRIESFLGRFGI